MTARPLYPVVMCGGAGTRLWPASLESRPKQFLRLTGARSMFQQTVLRVDGIAPNRLFVIGNIHHGEAIESQLAELGVRATILLEPTARDSGPALAAAVAAIAQRDADAIAVVVASDHYIPDAAAFRDAVQTAALAADQGMIVTLGVKASTPSTAYGYIRPKTVSDSSPVRPVAAFVEKPGPAKAASYVEAGYLWNSGNFIFAVDTMLNELDRHAPELTDAAKRAVRDGERDGHTLRLASSFVAAPKISIDYAVMEKTKLAAVLPVDFFWSDLGAWDAVHQACAKDSLGNSASGNCMLVNAERCFVRNELGVPVAAVGVSDIAIIAEPTGVLVCELGASQAVKKVAEKLAVGRRAPAARSPAESLLEWSAKYEHWLDTAALPLWWTLGADHVRGGFHEMLDGAAVPVPSPRRARVQARQAVVYATAEIRGWRGPGREAALHAMRWFRSRHLRDDGLFRGETDSDGRPTDDTATLYDQSFALLAMANLYRMGRAPDGLEREAELLLGRIRQTMGHEQCGFRESHASRFQSNPHMHLLETALAWTEAGGSPSWQALSQEIVALALKRFIDPDDGFVREHFTEKWEPALGERGRIVEPGHQFEWAWLLARWSQLGNEPAAMAAARRLFAAGAHGIDPVRNVAIDALNEDLTVRSSCARLWPQTERLKAALLLHEMQAADADDCYLAHAVSAAESLWRYLDMPTVGLWRDKLLPTNRFVEEPSPASSFYHIAGAVAALKQFRLARQSGIALAAQ